MAKKIIVSAPGAWHAFDTSVGLAQELLNAGDEVDFLLCNGRKIYCPANPFLEKPIIGRTTCTICKITSQKKLSKLQNKTKLEVIPFDDGAGNLGPIDGHYFDEQIQKMAFSNLQARFAQTKITGSKKTIDVFLRILIQNKYSYIAAEKFLSMLGDAAELIIFNGRLSGFFQFVDLAEKQNRKYFCFEHPDSGRGVFLVKSSVVHDPANVGNQIFEKYKASKIKDEDSLTYARAWMSDRKQGLSKDKNAIFMRGRTNQTLYFEEQLSNFKRVFTFFVSCEYELDFIAESVYLFYMSQIDFIKDLLENYLEPVDALIIRMHPNMVNVDQNFRDAFIQKVMEYELENVFIVMPDEDISSLKCIEISDYVFGFGSTTTIEAALFGKPVISLCNRPWSKFGFDYELEQVDDLRVLICEIDKDFCEHEKELLAARFLHTLHNSFTSNQLVSSMNSWFFTDRKINLWFRVMNYINKILLNLQYNKLK